MNLNVTRLFAWSGLLMLCSVVVLSCAQERAGFDRFHEVACNPEPPRACAPTGRTVVLTRLPGDATALPPRLPRVRIDVHAATGLLEAHDDQVRCTVPDVNNFACRELAGALRAWRADGEMAPWRMVHGRLFNDTVARDRVHYLNGFELWRNRLLFLDHDL